MNRRFLFMAGFAFPVATFAQGAADPDTFADNWETVAAGGGRFFFALIAGILLAYAFQWILTSLSLATGATAMGAATKKQRKKAYREDRFRREGRFREEEGYREEDRVRIHDQDKDYEGEGRYRRRHEERDEKEVPDREEGWEKPVMKIQSGVGIWALVTTGISTFVACWLASELIRFGGRAEAVILCLTIWAGFMLSMMWMEASVLGTVFGHIVNTFKGGVKSAFAPIKSMAGAAGEKASATMEEITAKVKEEFAAQGGGEGIKDRLKGFASGIQAPALERSRLEQDSEHLFHDADVREAARQGGRIDRRRIEEIVASRGDLGPDDARTLTEVLHGRWNRCVKEARQSQGAPSYASQSSYAQAPANSQAPAVAPFQPESAEAPRLEVHTGAGGSNPNSNIGPAAPSGEARASEGIRSYSSGGPASGAYGSQSVSPMSGQSQIGTPMAGYGMMGQGAGRSVGGPSVGFPARFQGFKDFLRASDKHDLNPARIEQEIESLVIHPEEGSAGMERSIREVNRDEVVQCLRQRRDITLQESDSIADLVDAARQRMLSRSEIREHRTQEASDKALAKIRDWVYGLRRPELDYDSFRSDFSKMLEDPKAGFASLKGKAQSVDRNQLLEAFAAKKGISREEAEKMADQAENAMRAAQEQTRRIEEEARRRMEKMRRASLEQAEATRKVAASAAWWLFGIACFTALCAALGGLTGAAT